MTDKIYSKRFYNNKYISVFNLFEKKHFISKIIGTLVDFNIHLTFLQ